MKQGVYRGVLFMGRAVLPLFDGTWEQRHQTFIRGLKRASFSLHFSKPKSNDKSWLTAMMSRFKLQLHAWTLDTKLFRPPCGLRGRLGSGIDWNSTGDQAERLHDLPYQVSYSTRTDYAAGSAVCFHLRLPDFLRHGFSPVVKHLGDIIATPYTVTSKSGT